jgi:hypothetical protein
MFNFQLIRNITSILIILHISYSRLTEGVGGASPGEGGIVASVDSTIDLSCDLYSDEVQSDLKWRRADGVHKFIFHQSYFI